MNNRLRLLAIIEATSITGPAKNLIEFASLAGAEGIDTVIATFVRGAGSNVFLDRARTEGIPLEQIPESRAFDWSVVRALREMAMRVRPDVIQTHAVKSHFLARAAGLPRIAPWVAFHHGYTFTSRKTQFYNQLDRWSLPAAGQVLTVSGPFRDELVAKGVDRRRIDVIHNAIRPDWGREARKEESARALRERWRIPEHRAVVLIVGRLSREKDHICLLRAVRSILARREIQLVVVGDGPERAPIEAAIRELGLGDFVTLTGQQPSAEPYYGIAAIAVLSSLSEGSPNALLEAMAAGVPAVATQVGGIPEIVTHEESALLAPPGDSDALAAALLRILVEEPHLGEALASRARTLVLERHTPQARVCTLSRIYHSVAARPVSHARTATAKES
ncbi:MAG: glycosyltransferase [Bryobacterales bacterium]|nr:glycosyltransferase [Bryobacterales bacterium]